MSKVVFTNGCFDLLHLGHIRTLKYARQLADQEDGIGLVVVGLNSDSSVKRLKGDSRPILSQDVRYEMLKSIKYVDDVFLFSEDTPKELILRLQPDIIVKGPEYDGTDVVGSNLAKIKIVPKNYTVNISTTKIIERIKYE